MEITDPADAGGRGKLSECGCIAGGAAGRCASITPEASGMAGRAGLHSSVVVPVGADAKSGGADEAALMDGAAGVAFGKR